MNDKPKTRGRATTPRARVAGAATMRPRGEEASMPAKKGTRARGTERASSLLRNRKTKTQDADAVEAQVVGAPTEEPIVASPPEAQTSARPPEMQANEIEENTAGQDKAGADAPVEDTKAAPTKTNDGPSEADTDTDSQSVGSAAAEASTEAASEIPQTKPRAKGTRRSSGARSGPAAETVAPPKTRATKTRMPKAEPVAGKRAAARTAEAKTEPGSAEATRGRAARKQAEPVKEEAPTSVEAPRSRRKPAARKAASGADPVIDQQPRRKAPRKERRKPGQTPASPPPPANPVADIPMSPLVAAAAKPKADKAPVKRAEATASGAAPDRIMRETMEIAQIGFTANAEMLQALLSARTPAELLEVQVRGMQIMADVWTRQAARIQELYVKTIRGGHRS